MPVPKTGALPLGYAPARAALYSGFDQDVKGAKTRLLRFRYKLNLVTLGRAACPRNQRVNGVP